MKAINPKTGEEVEYVDGRWIPVKGASAEALGKPDPLAGKVSSGPVESALASAGDVFATMGRNVRGAVASVRGDTAGQEAIAAERAEAGDIRDRMRQEAPIASMVGGALPSLATLPLGGGLAAQAGIGALLGGLQSETGELGEGAAVGGALSLGGGMVGNVVGRVASARKAAMGARNARMSALAGQVMTEGEQGVIEGARRAGLQLTPGQAANSPAARKVEASLASNPATSPVFDALERANTEQTNRLAARAMGVDADNVGPAVRARAHAQIGEDFREVGKALGTVDAAPLHQALRRIADEEATAALPTSAAWQVLKRFEKGQGARFNAVAGGNVDEIPGKALVQMRSQVSKEMRDAFAANRSDKGAVLAEVLEEVDTLIGNAARAQDLPEVVERYIGARSKWTVAKAMDSGGASMEGNVLPGQAANLIRKADKTGLWGLADEAGNTTQRTGTGVLGENPVGDLYDALRFRTSQLGKPIVGDSGTATRSVVGQLMQGGGVTGAALAGARGLAVSPVIRAYTNMSPEAALTAEAALRAARGQPAVAYGQAGAQAARPIGQQ